MRERDEIQLKKWRLYVIILLLLLIIIALISRVAYLTVIDSGFLNKQGNARSIRVDTIPAYRGMLLDRNGNPLAVSTPVTSVWINSLEFSANDQQKSALATALGMPVSDLQTLLEKNKDKQFVYLQRNLSPDVIEKVKALNLSGVNYEKSYRRYYPDGAAVAHLIGMTNVDNQGISGFELVYNKELQGVPGKMLVEQDRYGHTIAVLGQEKSQEPGKNVKLSIDQSIQFLAYNVLQEYERKFQAESASVVVLDTKTGQVLAMANLPSYNPNNKQSGDAQALRNRALTDVYEPGSVMKTFAIVNALESRKFTPGMKIDTHPGYFYLNGHQVDDEGKDHGILTVTQVLQVSSNVGITKMMLQLPSDSLWQVLNRFEFGEPTGSGFPGEQRGSLVHHKRWAPIMIATLSFGYGVSVTPLQLARAYAAIANQGMLLPVTFDPGVVNLVGKRVMSQDVAATTMTMLESVVSKSGSGYLAGVPGYHVAGKTGTAWIAQKGGYSHRHIETFVSIAPVSNPRLVVVVMFRKPQGKIYYASYVTAPVAGEIMAGALQLLNISPDDIASYQYGAPDAKHWAAPV